MNLIKAIEDEMRRQDEKWGPQRDIQSVLSQYEGNAAWYYMWQDSATYKEYTDRRFELEVGTWADILCEEVAEALDASDTDGTRINELIQVAAVCLQWAKNIELRMKNENQ